MAEMKVLSHEAESLSGGLHERVSTTKERYARLARRILREVQQRVGGASTVDLTVATYALFGMMNWIYNWYDSSGKLSVNQLIDNMTRLFLTGFLASETEPLSPAIPRSEKVSIWRTA